MKPDKTTSHFLPAARLAARERLRNSWLRRMIPIIGLLISTGLAAQAPKPTEYQVKAAYIYNFGKFVKWPPNAAASRDNSFTICILGDDPFGASLPSTLVGQSIGGKPVAVKRVTRPQDAMACLILFITAEEKDHLKGILDALGQSPVLTVSDMPDFSSRGGMVQFMTERDRVRFEINRTSAEFAGLTLTSDLLRVAVAVRVNGRTGDR
jgi:hypothetical protein